MTLSEVFYEAACRMSALKYDEWSCMVVAEVCHSLPIVAAYQEMMRVHLYGDGFTGLTSADVHAAAKLVGWTEKNYRTFMLLMASEAVK